MGNTNGIFAIKQRIADIDKQIKALRDEKKMLEAIVKKAKDKTVD